MTSFTPLLIVKRQYAKNSVPIHACTICDKRHPGANVANIIGGDMKSDNRIKAGPVSIAGIEVKTTVNSGINTSGKFLEQK